MKKLPFCKGDLVRYRAADGVAGIIVRITHDYLMTVLWDDCENSIGGYTVKEIVHLPKRRCKK